MQLLGTVLCCISVQEDRVDSSIRNEKRTLCTAESLKTNLINTFFPRLQGALTSEVVTTHTTQTKTVHPWVLSSGFMCVCVVSIDLSICLVSSFCFCVDVYTEPEREGSPICLNPRSLFIVDTAYSLFRVVQLFVVFCNLKKWQFSKLLWDNWHQGNSGDYSSVKTPLWAKRIRFHFKPISNPPIQGQLSNHLQ